jgi:hypothetical protein
MELFKDENKLDGEISSDTTDKFESLEWVSYLEIVMMVSWKALQLRRDSVYLVIYRKSSMQLLMHLEYPDFWSSLVYVVQFWTVSYLHQKSYISGPFYNPYADWTIVFK